MRRRLVKDGDQLSGHGKGRAITPRTRTSREIGAGIAVARALSELAHGLLNTAAAELEDVTHQRVRLSM